MLNKNGILIPRKCLTCHYKRDSSIEGKIKCSFYFKFMDKSDCCDVYIMNSKYDKIGRSFGKVKSPKTIDSYRKAMEENCEDLHNQNENVQFIF